MNKNFILLMSFILLLTMIMGGLYLIEYLLK
jgi:hypothetical protein